MANPEQVEHHPAEPDGSKVESVGLHYPLTMHQLESGEYCAEVPDLPGCRSVGESVEKALEMLFEASEAWMAEALQRGEEIPPPRESAAAWVILPLSQSLLVSYQTRARRRGVNLPDLLMEALDCYHARI
jgi:predicted RNase H-like HicB family nuclease